jgi:hypothetical protein
VIVIGMSPSGHRGNQYHGESILQQSREPADMTTNAQHLKQQRSIDVTGLPDEAIRAVESLIALLRNVPSISGPQFSSDAERSKAIREWAESHQSPASAADWSRESIYGGRGE